VQEKLGSASWYSITSKMSWIFR